MLKFACIFPNDAIAIIIRGITEAVFLATVLTGSAGHEGRAITFPPVLLLFFSLAIALFIFQAIVPNPINSNVASCIKYVIALILKANVQRYKTIKTFVYR